MIATFLLVLLVQFTPMILTSPSSTTLVENSSWFTSLCHHGPYTTTFQRCRRKRSVTSAVTDVDEYATNIGEMQMIPLHNGDRIRGMINKRNHVAKFTTHNVVPLKSFGKKGRNTKAVCWETCHPGSFQECAIPRCQLKVGVIRRLCFLLCKQQEEHCNETCGW